MNFFHEAGYKNDSNSSSLINYLNVTNADEMIRGLSERLDVELQAAEKNNPISRSASMNLLNIIGIPTIILFVILITKCIPFFVKLLVIVLVVVHIIIGTVFIVSTEQHKQKLNINNLTQSLQRALVPSKLAAEEM